MVKKLAPALFLCLCLLLVFFPLFSAGYILNFDDNTHLLENKFIVNGHLSAAWKIFFSPNTANKTYIPLTVLTFLYEQVWVGLNPFVSHTINILLHGLVCALVWCFGLQLGLSRRAVYVALLVFAIHPMHVESVAWVTSRKDMLYASFYLVALISYGKYLEKNTARDYIVALAAAGLSVLAKPMALSLPLILWLVDAMKGRRLSWAVVLDKLPFFLAVEPVALITYTLNARVIPLVWPASFLTWWWCAAFYLQKFCWPAGLSIIYTVPSTAFSWGAASWQWGGILAGARVLTWLDGSRRFLLFAGGFYAVSLFFIWRFDTGTDLTIVGDRFMYLPSLGICFLVGKIADQWWQRFFMTKGIVFAGIFLLAVISFQRAGEWKDPFCLWRSAVRVCPSVYSLNSFGDSLVMDEYYFSGRDSFMKMIAQRLQTSVVRMKVVFGKDFEKKIEGARWASALRSCSRVAPAWTDPRLYSSRRRLLISFAYHTKGKIFIALHRYDKAREYFDKAVRICPYSLPLQLFNRGVACQYLGKSDLAMNDYDKALRVDGKFYFAYVNRAQIRLSRGELSLALADALAAVEAGPTYAPAYEMAILVARALGNARLEEALVTARRLVPPEKQPYRDNDTAMLSF